MELYPVSTLTANIVLSHPFLIVAQVMTVKKKKT